MNQIRSLSKEELEQAIAKLRDQYAGLEIEAGDTREVLSDCIEALGGLLGGQTATAEPRDWWFFRVRSASGFESESAMLEPNQYHHLPAGSCRNMGRCHVPGHPVFYGSDSYEGAIREMKRPDEKQYLLAAWRLPARRITRLNFLFGSNISANRLIENRDRALADGYDQYGFSDDLNRERLKALMVAWSDLFLSGSDYYAITASIAHQCIYEEFGAARDFVAYGSALDGSYVNYAIHPDLASELELYRIYACKLADLSAQVRFVRYAERQPNGIFAWQKMNKDELPHNNPNMPTEIEHPVR